MRSLCQYSCLCISPNTPQEVKKCYIRARESHDTSSLFPSFDPLRFSFVAGKSLIIAERRQSRGNNEIERGIYATEATSFRIEASLLCCHAVNPCRMQRFFFRASISHHGMNTSLKKKVEIACYAPWTKSTAH
jgi:hypothetical protein